MSKKTDSTRERNPDETREAPPLKIPDLDAMKPVKVRTGTKAGHTGGCGC